MHVADGILPISLTLGGYVGAAVIVARGLRELTAERVPRVALLTAGFLVGSLIHVPLGPSSVHLLLHGLVGIILGPLCGIAIFVALALQAVLIGHGGITALGFNTLAMSAGAAAAWFIFQRLGGPRNRHRAAAAAFLAGSVAVCFSAVIVFGALWLTGEDWRQLSRLVLLAHAPIAVIEGLIAAGAAAFLARVQPDLLRAVPGRGSAGFPLLPVSDTP